MALSPGAEGPFHPRMAQGVNRERLVSGAATCEWEWLGMRREARSDTRTVRTGRASFSRNSPESSSPWKARRPLPRFITW